MSTPCRNFVNLKKPKRMPLKIILFTLTMMVVSCVNKNAITSLTPASETKDSQDLAVKRIQQEKDEKIVRFAYDSSKIDQDSAKYIDKKIVSWLKENPNVKIIIEGHCDERGSNEYNQSLGKKRGDAVLTYLAYKGVSKSRMKVISYGETKPLSLGHGEEYWSNNRRSVVVTTK